MCRIARALNGKIQVELLPKAVDCPLIIGESFAVYFGSNKVSVASGANLRAAG